MLTSKTNCFEDYTLQSLHRLKHIVPKKTYFLIFGALLALTALTTSVAYLNLGQ